ncbi:485_t:CDS:1, partial [Racocetra fulgida]
IVSPRNENGVLVILSPLVEDMEVEESFFIDLDNKSAAKELQQTLDALHIRNPMSIEELLDFEEEKIEIHQQFNDNDLIQAATEIEHAENEVIIQSLTGKEQLDILRNVLRIVDERIDD